MPGVKLTSVCVFCGSRPGDDPAFLTAASELGAEIATRGLTLVYGGARVGLMGAVANAALAVGGKVIGAIPKTLVAKEIVHDALPELYLTETMHERKNRMMELSDAFVCLPGGFGTYDELFETITLAQIGIHEKPTALLNVKGYYDPLVHLLQHTIAHDFAAPEHHGLVLVDDDPKRLLDKVRDWKAPPLGSKALDRRGTP